MLHDDTTASQTYELYGPTNYSTAEIAELVDREIIKHRRHVNVPRRLLKPIANALNRLIWWHTMSEPEVDREFYDQEIDREAKTLKDLGIQPDDLAGLTFHYLVSFSTCASCVYSQLLITRLCSKNTGARRSTTYRPLPSGRGVRRRNICMSLTINDSKEQLAELYVGRIQCIVSTIFPVFRVLFRRDPSCILHHAQVESGL